MNNVITIIPHSKRRFIDVAREAVAGGCRIMTDGKTVIASPQKMPGWFVVPVKIRRAA